MNLFGIDVSQGGLKRKETLIDISKRILGIDKGEVINELNLYLKNRKQQRNFPSKVSWELQMNKLKTVPKQQMVPLIHRATIRGYRQLVFEDTVIQPSRNIDNTNYKIMDKGF